MYFNAAIRETTEIAELIYLDVCKLWQFPSRKSDKFMLIVMVYYSRKTWVFVLSYMFEAIVKIRQLRALIETKISKMIKDVPTGKNMDFYL